MAANGASGSASESAFPAETFIGAGAHFVVPDYQLVQEAGGSLMPMADQMRRAVAWIYRNAASFGGDPNRLYVAGHSAGGHLAAAVLTTDWAKEFGLPADTIKGGICISGMYDLKPVRLSFRRNYIKFDDELEQALSPQRHLDKLTTPLIVAYGTFGDASNSSDRAGFRGRRESRRKTGAARRRRKLCAHGNDGEPRQSLRADGP